MHKYFLDYYSKLSIKMNDLFSKADFKPQIFLHTLKVKVVCFLTSEASILRDPRCIYCL